MGNILTDAVNAFYLIKGQHIETANACAHSLIGAVTNNKIILATPLGDLTADGMFVIVGKSGTIKSIPMKRVYNMARRLNFEIPSIMTVAALRDYFALKNKDHKYVHSNNGLMYWDEMSARFTDAQKLDYMTGTIEAISCIYDHRLDTTYLKSEHRVARPRDPYVAMLGAMVPSALPNIPPFFWSQGIAGRINWTYVPEEKKEPVNWKDFRNRKKADSELSIFEINLKTLKHLCEHLKKPIITTVDADANDAIMEFQQQMDDEWLSRAKGNMFSWDEAYLSRLAEMAGKSALRHALGRYFSENSNLKNFEFVNGEDMKYGINQTKKSRLDLEYMYINIKEEGVKQFDPKSRIIRAIVNAKNQMLHLSQWKLDSSTSDPGTFIKYVNELVRDGKVKRVDKSTITDENEKNRLRTNTVAKIYTWVK